MISALKNQGITEPTEVQEAAVPVILSGKNAIVRAETGSGQNACPTFFRCL